MADESKAKGNAAFAARNYNDAIKHFTDAIALSPNNHILFSNRSAAYASLNRFSDSLLDAKKTVQLNPNWAKGYSRLGAAYMGLNNIEEAIESYEKGLAIVPNNEALKSGVSDAKRKMRSNGCGMNPFSKIFEGPEMWAKLTANPTTRAYLQQLDFLKMVQDVQRNPGSINMYLRDERMMNALGVLLNVNLRGANGSGDMETQSREKEKASESVKEEKAEVVPEPIEEEVVDELRRRRKRGRRGRRMKRKQGMQLIKRRILIRQLSVIVMLWSLMMRIFPS